MEFDVLAAEIMGGQKEIAKEVAEVKTIATEIMKEVAEVKVMLAQPEQIIPSKNPQQSTKQYNAVANSIQAIGEGTIKGKHTYIFGVCSKCGQPIASSSVIGYCKVNGKLPECWGCQKGKSTAKVENVKYYNSQENHTEDNASTTPAPAPSVGSNHIEIPDGKFKVHCSNACGGYRVYSSYAAYKEKELAAIKAGVKPHQCRACIEKAKQEQAPVVERGIDLREAWSLLSNPSECVGIADVRNQLEGKKLDFDEKDWVSFHKYNTQTQEEKLKEVIETVDKLLPGKPSDEGSTYTDIPQNAF